MKWTQNERQDLELLTRGRLGGCHLLGINPADGGSYWVGVQWGHWPELVPHDMIR